MYVCNGDECRTRDVKKEDTVHNYCSSQKRMQKEIKKKQTKTGKTKQLDQANIEQPTDKP